MTKISKKAFQTANQQGIFKEFQFYLCIKSINKPGYFPSGNYLKLIQERIKEYNSANPYKKLPSSQSQISRLINKLDKLGFLRRNKTGIYLTSYKKVFAQLDCSDRWAKTYDRNTFIEDFCFLTFRNRINKLRKYMKKTHPHIKATGEFETFFSCQTLADMFGFKSKSQGYRLRTYFESKRFIEVTSYGYKLLGASRMNKHYPGCFKWDGLYFHKPACSIRIIL